MKLKTIILISLLHIPLSGVILNWIFHWISSDTTTGISVAILMVTLIGDLAYSSYRQGQIKEDY